MASVRSRREYWAFDPERTRLLGRAFDTAWARLEVKCLMADHNVTQTRERLGQWIFTLAEQGEQDASLANSAVVFMRIR
jgi:hypothetical protein